MKSEFSIRTDVRPEDVEHVREIVVSTNFFHDYEVEVAIELLQETLNKGTESGYHFLFVESGGRTIAYSCFGLIPCTASSFDLYWIVVHNDYRNHGIGKELLELTEKAVAKMGGTALYAETSSQEKYAPTRKFYLSNHYFEEARLKNFYQQDDDKLIYTKQIS
jgi:N-acetylglutamate synthase-like GNAT family acetyltransferase